MAVSPVVLISYILTSLLGLPPCYVLLGNPDLGGIGRGPSPVCVICDDKIIVANERASLFI